MPGAQCTRSLQGDGRESAGPRGALRDAAQPHRPPRVEQGRLARRKQERAGLV